MIPNHSCAKLSELDLEIARIVPPGGNWRNVPPSVPSNRLAQIRVSAAAGEGSRSTYYGRLRPDRPSYTINTYYNRPGNGCFLHYDFAGGQHRTLSNREAARFQSFPDSFVFNGTQRSVCQQIGNAVPPLLGLQVALRLGSPGAMIDVFAGAGGLSLGFEWAGWRSISATDSDSRAVLTFNRNVAPVAFVGDMTDEATREQLLAAAETSKGSRLALVGGPPCYKDFQRGTPTFRRGHTKSSIRLLRRETLTALKPDIFCFRERPRASVLGPWALLPLSGGGPEGGGLCDHGLAA